ISIARSPTAATRQYPCQAVAALQFSTPGCADPSLVCMDAASLMRNLLCRPRRRWNRRALGGDAVFGIGTSLLAGRDKQSSQCQGGCGQRTQHTFRAGEVVFGVVVIRAAMEMANLNGWPAVAAAALGMHDPRCRDTPDAVRRLFDAPAEIRILPVHE